MLEILQDFESALGGAVRLNPLVVVGAGLAAVIAGLFIWLGGLGFRKPLVAITGAISGGIAGFFIIGRNYTSAAFTAALAAVIAIVFERLFMAILTAVLVAVFAFIILAGPNIEQAQEPSSVRPAEIPPYGSTLSVRESTEKMKTYIIDAAQKLKQACLRMPVYYWAIILVMVLIFIVAGLFLRRLASAFCCSTLGTTLIFTGMILLLLNKGALPVSRIRSKPSFYATVFIAMVAFGTFEQLLLCKRLKSRSAGKRKAGKKKGEPDRVKESWRST